MRQGPAPGASRSTRTRAGGVRAPKVRRSPATPSSGGSRKRSLTPLLSVVCHDLRAPLAAVTMGANYVLQAARREDENARAVNILEAMLRSCTQMERLIRNFADLSEIETGTVTLRLGLHDAGEMLALAAAAAEGPAHARAITLDIAQPEPPISLQCDRDRILRTLGHVVENAVKFAPNGSRVTLSVTLLNSGMVAFAVSDRGPGLTPQVRRNLFNRQWHAKRASRVGTGFGLIIARGILKAHGGRILVESQPNEPTTFTLCVPKDTH